MKATITNKRKLKMPTGGICPICDKQGADTQIEIKTDWFRGDDVYKNIHEKCIAGKSYQEVAEIVLQKMKAQARQ
jgi:hypothetical protein